ncbi:capsular polysaccharide transport system permease protein [Sphingomonas gellani]|uniref:Capsular polysaccharide transport system permease protein n=1 Tax=Sphingomonas gellani TaxID=1166340 RepID=A0A1H8I7D7_9SPHN|nr:ABC transporter permease [Sphingomonas gellani]SEN64055.1 capsular polysaccharide transport system permease protein [Sphingomonas gellani]
MPPHSLSRPNGGSFATGLATQMRVIGALLMRELHTRYGRENIGYLWLIGEPLMLAGVMALLHTSGHTAYGSDIKPLPFIVVGYTTYIMFRGIVNRSDSALTSNAPLLYHRMVTIFDIVVARALLEAAGTFLAYSVLMALLWSAGLVALPARPLFFYAAQGLMFWYSLSHSMIIASITFHNRTMERLVHPYTYFMIPLSGAFFQVEMVPEPYRSWLMLVPLPHIMELARYGQFNSANLDYCDPWYVVGACMILTWVGLVTMRIYRNKVHLN